MSTNAAKKLDQLFDRTWRPGHPFRPRLSAFRRRATVLALSILVGIIVGYVYLTDSTRVRHMCETYLSQLVGGKVTVKSATLSIFQGLKLNGVDVYVDDRRAPDALIFEAETLQIQYNLQSILSGKLEATDILAIEPHVHLCEDVDDTSGRRWNYSRMLPARPPVRPGGRTGVLPTITLRNGIIEYSQMQHGSVTKLGEMALDGGMTPPADLPDDYFFRFQSRGEDLGPVVTGSLIPSTGQIKDAQMDNFQFSSDIKAMLPIEVRQWWDYHGLSGRVDISALDITPGRDGASARFSVATDLQKVDMLILPSEWMSSEESNRLEVLHGAFNLMRVAGLNGRIPGAGLHFPDDSTDAAPASAPAPVAPPVRHRSPGLVDWLAALAEPSAIHLDKVTGSIIFTHDGTGDGIRVKKLEGWIEHNSFTIDGHIDGYSPSAPADIVVKGTEIYIPHTPRYLNSLPRPVHEFWEHLHPEGSCMLSVHLHRDAPGARPEVDGRVDVREGELQSDRFPYPLRKVTGQITFGPDRLAGGERCDIVDLRGLGVAGGPNADSPILINGFVAPLTPDGECSIVFSAPSISLEPALNDAFPPQVRQVVRMFDTGGTRGYPLAHGALRVVVYRPPGPGQVFGATLSLDIDDASGSFEVFPYHLDHVKAKVEITPGRVEITNARAQRGDATIRVDGTVQFGDNQPVDPHLTIVARNVPIDQQLLDALPPDKKPWLEKLGITGKLDVDGLVARQDFTPSSLHVGADHIGADHAGAERSAVPGHITDPTPIDFDLRMSLHDARLAPPDTNFSLDALTGQLRLTSEGVVLTDLKAHRGGADLVGSGSVVWNDHGPYLTASATAHNLLLDTPLYNLLATDARRAWDQVQPNGTVDADLTYQGPVGSDASPPAPGPDAPPAPPAPAPAAEAQPAIPAATYLLTLKPRQLAVTFKPLPYTMSDLQGAMTIAPGKVTLQNVTGAHGKAAIGVAGVGTLDSGLSRQSWDIHLVGRDVPLTDDLKKTLPPALGRLMDTLEATGSISFDFPHFTYACSTAPATGPATAPFASDADIDLAGQLWLKGGTLHTGVPLTGVNGVIDLATQFRGGHLGEFKGQVNIASMDIAERPADRFVATLYKPSDRDAIKIDHLGGRLAGGELSGQVDFTFPDTGPSRFAMAMTLRNVDVKEFARLNDTGVKGQLNASLSLEGNWGEPASRRGRGDVDVSGEKMYKIPLVLGLLQITNLSLPISSPFNQATARYSVAGPQVTFENLDLRASNMVMTGTGSMNFQTRKVKMTFVTDNPNWPQLPLVQGLIQGARNELLQIHVNGTIQAPKVSAGMMNTFTTTVDQVLKGKDTAADTSDTGGGAGDERGAHGR